MCIVFWWEVLFALCLTFVMGDIIFGKWCFCNVNIFLWLISGFIYLSGISCKYYEMEKATILMANKPEPTLFSAEKKDHNANIHP